MVIEYCPFELISQRELTISILNGVIVICIVKPIAS